MKEQIEVKTRWQKRLERNDKDAKREIEELKESKRGNHRWRVGVSCLCLCDLTEVLFSWSWSVYVKGSSFQETFFALSAASVCPKVSFWLFRHPERSWLTHTQSSSWWEFWWKFWWEAFKFLWKFGEELCLNGCDRSNKHMLICHFHFLNFTLHFHFLELSSWSVKEYRSEELCWTHAKKRYCPGTKIPRCTAHVQKTCQCRKKHKETVLNADHPQPP